MAKIKTNLSPKELEKVAKGMLGLARSRSLAHMAADSPTELTLLTQFDKALDIYSKSLQSEFTRILAEEDNNE